MSNQRILSIDSQILNSIQSCARKTKYSFEMNLKTPDKAEALERGDLMHKMLEIYYFGQVASVYRNVNTLLTELFEVGIYPLPSNNNLSELKDFAIKAAR